ncbi:MAG TPA: WHG domain-containing protein [Ureibacillus sp.]|nr:WHG domain-containing protein [Ureibacillus sp.]
MPRVGLDLNRIIKTAIEIADNEGIEAVTLATLARRLSVKSPSLFNHINGLSSLKREMSLYGLNLLFDKLKCAKQDKQSNDAMVAIANAYIEFTREHPGLYELTIKAPEENDQEIEEISNGIIKLIIDVLGDFQLDEEAIIHTIRGFRSILHGFASLEQKGAFGMPISTEESFHFIIKSFLATLKSK